MFARDPAHAIQNCGTVIKVVCGGCDEPQDVTVGQVAGALHGPGAW
jgi:hypothetical protein